MPEIADSLKEVGIEDAFPIQEMTLSVALMGTDLIGQARTGTGKTLAFSIPLIQRTVARLAIEGIAAKGGRNATVERTGIACPLAGSCTCPETSAAPPAAFSKLSPVTLLSGPISVVIARWGRPMRGGGPQ